MEWYIYFVSSINNVSKEAAENYILPELKLTRISTGMKTLCFYTLSYKHLLVLKKSLGFHQEESVKNE
jgi:hypothetical protein